MENPQNRHDLSDAQWLKIEPIFKERIWNWGGANANRVFVTAFGTSEPARLGVICRRNMESTMRFTAARKDGAKGTIETSF